MLNNQELLKMFESAGAIRHGHFELSSGLHSAMYVQCALVLRYPRYAERLGQALAGQFSDATIQTVVSPAMGGVIIGQEVARALPAGKFGAEKGVPAVFVERNAGGSLCLRRGFSFEPGERVLVIEDVWTTGGSTFETMQVIEEAGGRVVAVGALIDRSAGEIEFPVESQSLLALKIPSYQTEECPQCREGSAAVKPGSRFVRSAP
jgi:orotate phosphoribosyltransferase